MSVSRGEKREKMTNTEENSTETNTLLTMEEVIGGGKEDSMTNLWEEDGKFVSRGDKGEEMTKNKAESAKNNNIWVVGGNSLVGMLFHEF